MATNLKTTDELPTSTAGIMAGNFVDQNKALGRGLYRVAAPLLDPIRQYTDPAARVVGAVPAAVGGAALSAGKEILSRGVGVVSPEAENAVRGVVGSGVAPAQPSATLAPEFQVALTPAQTDAATRSVRAPLAGVGPTLKSAPILPGSATKDVANSDGVPIRDTLDASGRVISTKINTPELRAATGALQTAQERQQQRAGVMPVQPQSDFEKAISSHSQAYIERMAQLAQMTDEQVNNGGVWNAGAIAQRDKARDLIERIALQRAGLDPEKIASGERIATGKNKADVDVATKTAEGVAGRTQATDRKTDMHAMLTANNDNLKSLAEELKSATDEPSIASIRAEMDAVRASNAQIRRSLNVPNGVAPEETAPTVRIPQPAIEALLKNPALKSMFDAKYGAGASARYLRG